MSNIDQFIEQFQTAVDFQAPVDIKPETLLADLPEWDSLAALGVIVMFDMEYTKTVTGNDLQNSKTISDLFALTILLLPSPRLANEPVSRRSPNGGTLIEGEFRRSR